MDSPRKRVFPTWLFVAAILVIAAAIAAPSLAKVREAARRSACVNNLKQMGIILQTYADDNNGRFSRIDDTKGNLIFEGSQLYPEYLTDPDILGCPSDPGYMPGTTFGLKDKSHHPEYDIGQPHPDCFTCESYIYLGWVMMNEEEGLAALQAYLNASDDDLDTYLRVPAGKGNMGSNSILRLSSDIDRYLMPQQPYPDPNYPDSMLAQEGITYLPVIPVMWEWPTNHIPNGSNVLYLDGHVEYRRYPGEFPMTERFVGALKQIRPEFSSDVYPITDR